MGHMESYRTSTSRPVIEYWAQGELSDEDLLKFVDTLGSEHFAIHVQSKTKYSFELYARTVRSLWRANGAGRSLA